LNARRLTLGMEAVRRKLDAMLAESGEPSPQPLPGGTP